MLDDDFSSFDEPGRTAPLYKNENPPWPNEAAVDPRQPLDNSQYPKTRIPWRVLSAIVVIGTIAYGAFLHANRPATEPAPPAGWIDLAACNDAISLDGTRRLTLSENHAAELREAAPNGDNKNNRTGKWNYNEIAKEYAITFNDQTTNYSLLLKDVVATCILVKGNLTAANLLESWFATIDDGPSDDSRERDPY